MKDKPLQDFVDKRVRLIGRAENAKGGAVVLLQNQDVIYIRDLSFWNDDILGKTIRINGILRREKFIPDPTISEDGGISQGAIGLQFVLTDADWILD